MQCGGFIKVGVSSNPESRVKSLQTGNPNKITIIARVWEDNATQAEAYFHSKFSNQKSIGEWFEINDSIASCVKDIKIREYRQAGGQY